MCLTWQWFLQDALLLICLQVFAYDHCFWSMDESVKEKYAGNVYWSFVRVVSKNKRSNYNAVFAKGHAPYGMEDLSPVRLLVVKRKRKTLNHSCFSFLKTMVRVAVGNAAHLQCRKLRNPSQ